MKKNYLLWAGLAAAILLGLASFQAQNQLVRAQTAFSCPPGAHCLTGWAWSANIGWVSFSSANAGSGAGATYGVSLATTSANPTVATLAGNAWSPNVGWISFDPADITPSNCPAATNCVPTVDLVTGDVSGWARALSIIDSNPTDGWIELAGANHQTNVTPGGVTFHPSTFTFSGFAYEPSSVGWLDFDTSSSTGGTTAVTCTDACAPVPGMTFQAQDPVLGIYSPALVVAANASGSTGPIQFVWVGQNISNVKTATGNWGVPIGSPLGNSGTTTLTFSNTSSVPTTTAVTLGYNAGFSQKTRSADVTINPYTPPPPVCATPANTVLCTGSNTNGMSPTINAYGTCPAIVSIGSCQFQCNANFSLKSGKCIKSSIQEI